MVMVSSMDVHQGGIYSAVTHVLLFVNVILWFIVCCVVSLQMYGEAIPNK